MASVVLNKNYHAHSIDFYLHFVFSLYDALLSLWFVVPHTYRKNREENKKKCEKEKGGRKKKNESGKN